jgi:phosphoglucosamine mutase
MSVAFDCGHGATSSIAPDVMNQLGVSCVKLHAEPNGQNINQASGSTHPDDLQRAVVDRRCHLGFGFDGDGDRVIVVDSKGEIVDGDGVLFMAARYLQASNRLRADGIVATVMSNFGLEVALAESGIQVYRCQVGDWHVREEMEKRGVCLGGEQSGHIIFSDFLPTGDGLATALLVMCIVVQSGQTLDELVADLSIFPQKLLNVPVKKKRDLATVPEFMSAVRKVEQQLAGHGRVLVRYSGTESLLRIMVEGPEQGTVDRLAGEIAACAQERLV